MYLEFLTFDVDLLPKGQRTGKTLFGGSIYDFDTSIVASEIKPLLKKVDDIAGMREVLDSCRSAFANYADSVSPVNDAALEGCEFGSVDAIRFKLKEEDLGGEGGSSVSYEYLFWQPDTGKVTASRAKRAAKASETAECGKSGLFEFKEAKDGLEVVRTWGRLPDEVVVPSEFGGKPVVSLGKRCLQKKSLGWVTLPDTLETIDDYAFKGARIARINIPASVRKIGEGAFEGATVNGLSTSVDSSLEEIGDCAFKGCVGLGLVSGVFSLPPSVRRVGKDAFATPYLHTLVFEGTAKGAYDFQGDLLSDGVRRVPVVVDRSGDPECFGDDADWTMLTLGYALQLGAGDIDVAPDKAREVAQSMAQKLLRKYFVAHRLQETEERFADNFGPLVASGLFSEGDLADFAKRNSSKWYSKLVIASISRE